MNKDETILSIGTCDRPNKCGQGFNNKKCLAMKITNMRTGAEVQLKCSAFSSAFKARAYVQRLYNLLRGFPK